MSFIVAVNAADILIWPFSLPDVLLLEKGYFFCSFVYFINAGHVSSCQDDTRTAFA